MRIVHFALENWRAIARWETDFSSGLNVLHGPNEAGKSSVVEALEAALSSDSFLKREVLPAQNPNASPKIRLELEVSGERAILTKIWNPDSCELVLGDQNWADERAQNELEKWRGAPVGLLISRQNQSENLAAAGAQIVRSSLGVAGDGRLVLSGRLEKVRAWVEAELARNLDEKWAWQAVESAKNGSEAARCRDELREISAQRARWAAILGEREEVRDEIEKWVAQLNRTGPQESQAATRVEQMGKAQLAQTEAERLIFEGEKRVQEANAAREMAIKRAAQWDELRQLQSADEAAFGRAAAQLEQAQTDLGRAQTDWETEQEKSENAERNVEAARQNAEAWRAGLAVYEAAHSLKIERQNVEILQNLGAQLQGAQQNFDRAPHAPTLEEIRRWREMFRALQSLESEAARGLQIEISPETLQHIEWRADQNAPQTETGERFSIGALGELLLLLPGWGELRIRSGARGLGELKAELETARRDLAGGLAAWETEISALPAAFDELENRRMARGEAERARQNALDNLRAEEARWGALAAASARLSEREAERHNARLACAPFEENWPIRGRKRAEIKAEWEAARDALSHAETFAARLKNEVAAHLQRWREAQNYYAQLAARPGELQVALATRGAQIAELDDGLDENARKTQLEKLSANLWEARREVAAARAKRTELGNGVSPWHIEESRRAALVLAENRADLEKKLAQKRQFLAELCEEDALFQMEQADAKIAVLTKNLARHEANLRGLALVNAAMQTAGSRVGRALAEPLNAQLAPTLSRLRGRETQLRWDENGGRIEAVATEGIWLPFEAHSAGLREQIAFVLRLVLALRLGKGPLILDDPLTQTDAARRAILGEILREAAANLQIIFVTCHDFAGAATRISLENSPKSELVELSLF